jgi:thioredoxin 1
MTDEKKYVTLTRENFPGEVLESGQPVLVDFWASWCGPCIAVAPSIEELAEEFDGVARVGKVNVDEQPGLAASYGIRSIPTLVLFSNGRPVEQIVGAVPKRVLAEKLNSLVAVA